MRLAVMSDIHGNILALEAVLRDLKQMGGADKTWVLGDLCVFGPRPAECIQMVRELARASVIIGNTDRYVASGERRAIQPKDESEWQKMGETLRQREDNLIWTVSRLSYADYEYLAKLRTDLSLEVPGYGWVIGYHGVPGDDERGLFPDTPDDEVLDQLLDREGRLAFGAHTHVPMDRDLGRWRVVNAGSVGMAQVPVHACYGLITFDGDSAQVDLRQVEYDVRATVRDLEQQAHPLWSQWDEKVKSILSR
jgi:predicted phosphodiesterase